MNANLPVFIGAIVLLIVIHELGHFIAAKWLGVEVEEFGLGFPPRAVTLFTLGGTIYSLNWIPLGGFVRPKGENDPNVPGGLAAASPWVRILVFAAGPFANFLAAIILFAYIFTRVGVPDVSQTLVTLVQPDSPAALAGLQPGDILTALNDEPITSPELLREAVARNLGLETRVTYLRGEEVFQSSLVPRENPPPNQGAMGIEYSHPVVKVGPVQAVQMGSLALYDQVMQILTLQDGSFKGRLPRKRRGWLGIRGCMICMRIFAKQMR